MDLEAAEPKPPAPPTDSGGKVATGADKRGKPEARIRRLHGRVPLSPLRAGTDAGKIADEVISHLTLDAAVSTTSRSRSQAW